VTMTLKVFSKMVTNGYLHTQENARSTCFL